MKDISSYSFIGVDTHKYKRTAAVIDCFNRCLGIVETPNNPICFNQFINQVRFYTDGMATLLPLDWRTQVVLAAPWSASLLPQVWWLRR